MIFSEEPDSYSLQASNLASPEELFSDTWLVMAGVDAIPPHIALISDGKYFSVSTKKVDTGTAIENFLKAIGRKNVPTIFMQIKPAPLNAPIRGIFERYPMLGVGDHSCLWPIRDYFTEAFDKKYEQATLVFELLAMAQEDELIKECKSLFIPTELFSHKNNQRIILPKYTHEQIREKINSLLKVNEH